MDRRVEQLQRQSSQSPGSLSLAGGLPAAHTFPLAALAKALGGTRNDALQYDWPEGREALRRWVAGRLRDRGADVCADDILLTSGAQQALDIAVRLTLPDGPRKFRVPDACYPGALEMFSSYDCELVGAASEAHLEYTMPVIENPTGRSLSPRRRTKILGQSHWILEDDAYAELVFDGAMPPPLLAEARERVLYVGTLSKTLCPGLRIGWLVTPPGLREGARRAKAAADLQGNTFAQSVVERYLAQEDYDARLASLRTLYAQNADALMTALKRHLPHCHFEAPRGGFSLWVTLPETRDEVELLQAAIARGTGFDPGADFQRNREQKPCAMRLSFSSLAAHDMDEAVKRLAEAFRDVSRPASLLVERPKLVAPAELARNAS